MGKEHERRHFWRAHFQSPVHVVVQGGVDATDLYDISLHGALVKLPDNWSAQPGDRCQLRLNLGTDISISMNTSISHIVGCRVGLRCECLDVDSATHLRRLVELNSGDPSLLDRELSALIHEYDAHGND